MTTLSVLINGRTTSAHASPVLWLFGVLLVVGAISSVWQKIGLRSRVAAITGACSWGFLTALLAIAAVVNDCG